ncbi:MAG: DUF4278 domain-containing protein [Oculatellaceae cyanobacterium Prado106]|jgi:hypothetical protein|nr:DUF4278 domain-containing protein [Oculatellaceae cyanobacterium Prado106]
MKLAYRATQYDYEPPTVDMMESNLSGEYRGQKVQFSYPRHIPTPQSINRLSYRGNDYQTTATGGIEALPHVDRHVPVAPSIQASTAAMWVQKARLTEADQAHRQAILQHLQHRIAAAQARGDEALLHQLEAEKQLFA